MADPLVTFNGAWQHDWFKPSRQQAGYPWTICRICGVVQRRDGKNQLCKGPTKLRPMEPCDDDD